MDFNIFNEFIKPEFMILIVVMYVVGMALKKTALIKDKFIPIILGVISILIVAIYLFATMSLNTSQDILMLIYMAITQGILCAAGSVYANQVYKQLTLVSPDTSVDDTLPFSGG